MTDPTYFIVIALAVLSLYTFLVLCLFRQHGNITKPQFRSQLNKLGKSRLGKTYDRVPDKVDLRDSFAPIPGGIVLPTKVDLSSFCSPVFNQGQVGSCTGHAAAGAFEYLQLAELRTNTAGAEQFDTSKYEPVSRLFIYYNERRMNKDTQEDAGATLRDAVKSLLYYGVCKESSWPYDESKFATIPPVNAYKEAYPHRISKYYRFADLEHIKHSLAAGYPVIFGITIYESFESDEVAMTGLVPMPGPQEHCLGGHAVMIVGYDDETQHVIVRNSWGTDWGIKGYFWLPYEYVTNMDLAGDFWSIRK